MWGKTYKTGDSDFLSDDCARNDTDADFYFHTDRVCILYKPV